jgi:nucleoside-diphosphate-sugar epimerase
MSLPIVVTGSEGFVGKHLRRVLTGRGIPVLGVDRPGTGAEVEQDLSDPSLDADALAARCGAVRGVIYMAATITRGSSVDAAARGNLRAISEASVELLEAFRHSAPEAHFVYCSTYKGYGPPEAQPIDPERPPQRPDPHSYGSAKALGERLLKIASARSGAKFAVVRPTCIYGPGQHLHNAIPIFLRSAWAGEAPTVFGTGRDVRDDVYAPDLSRALTEACLRRAVGAYHATGERPYTIWEVAELCCRAVAEVGGPTGLTPRLDTSKPPKWWLDQTFDNRRSRERLGYQPTPLLEGLKAEALWIESGADPKRAGEFAAKSEGAR